jgi:hypothetical protein
MFNARNLNGLYARADRKVYLSLGGKSPLFADSWLMSFPAGVWYVYTSGSPKRLYDDGSGIPGIGTDYRLNHDQTAPARELTKLDSVYVDRAGGQVFVDQWIIPGQPDPVVDVLAIHYSFELHRREINRTLYDVHLGYAPPDVWLDGVPQASSYVRSKFEALSTTPYFPPGRIHKHKTAVAEIACEGLTEFTIKREWQRFDCYRVHNCGSGNLTVRLELANGFGSRVTVPPFNTRCYRRRPNGEWSISWSGTNSVASTETCYFFPYFRGDIPFHAGGPAKEWLSGLTTGAALALESSAGANNLANPWVILEWQRRLRATLDPRVPYNARGNYGAFYADPANEDNLIGDCVNTWGRCILVNTTTQERKTVRINGMRDLEPKLNLHGITTSLVDETLSLSSGQWDRILPLDCSIFVTASSDYWTIGAIGSPTDYLLSYPRYKLMSPAQYSQWAAAGWSYGTPHMFQTIGYLRKLVAVEFGWASSVDDIGRYMPGGWNISDVTLTPLGLSIRVPNPTFTWDVASGVLGTTEYEGGSTPIGTGDDGLFPRYFPYGLGVGTSATDNFWSGEFHVLLATPSQISGVPSTKILYQDLFPAVNAANSSTTRPAVWTGYVPAGGPWAFSRTVYDYELRRVYEITAEGDTYSLGADFWINKWGGPGGVDASVRKPGRPNVTEQFIFDGNNVVSAGPDDIWFDINKPLRAGSTEAASSSYNYGFDGVTKIHNVVTSLSNTMPYYLPDGYRWHQKVAKTAWLWDLLEWSVRSWTRIHRRVVGERDIPVAPGIKLVDCLDSAGRGYEYGDPVVYLNYGGWGYLMALGVTVHDNGIESGTIYYVTVADLAAFIAGRGLGYNLDVINTPSGPTSQIVVANRRYGPAEGVESLSMYSVPLAWYRDAVHRFVDLRLPGEANF